jgi:hypothetical protein
MIGPLPTALGGFNRVLVAIDKLTKWIKVKPVTCPKADRVLDFLDELVRRYGLPHHIITDWVPTSTITNSGNIARTAGLMSGTSQPPTLGPTDKSSVLTGWCSTLSRSDYTMLQHKRGQGDQGTTQRSLGASYTTYQANRAVTLLPGLWLRSYATCRRNVGITGSRAV